MSDYFITNITGVPTTGQYGSDGKPLNVNNDGGIEVTPQGAGNVPSAGTESREGIGNDKSITGNPYNPNASSTDAQAIGPSAGNPKLSNRAWPDAQNLIRNQQRNAPSDNPFEELPYALGSYDWYKNESPAGSITPVYRSSMNIEDDTINEEGDTIGNYPYTDGYTFASPAVDTPRGGTTSTVTYTLGGNTTTRGTFGVTSPYPSNHTNCTNKENTLFPCEIERCSDSRLPGLGPLIGKKMRIFQGSGCSGEYPNKSLISGYWMQTTFTGQMEEVGTDRMPDSILSPEDMQDFGKDCVSFKFREVYRFGYLSTYKELLGLEKENSNPRLQPVGGARVSGCNCIEGLQDVMGIDEEEFFGKAFAHNLMYVGTSLADVKNSGWCEFGEARDAPVPADGLTNWFLEGSRCNPDGTRNDVFNSGKLFGACCTGDGVTFTKEVVYELTEVDSIVINSSDDPCDCKRRSLEGSKFLPEWGGANTCDGVYNPVISGCTEGIADQLFSLDEDNPVNLFVVDSGSGPPAWNSGECAWDIPVRPAARCTGLEKEYIENLDTTVSRSTSEWLTRKYTRLYCPSGSPTTIPDRNLWSKGADGIRPYKVDYDLCCTGVCTPPCTLSPSLFEVGDYVNISSYQLSGYMNALGGFSGAFEIDFSQAFHGHSSPDPFFTGCEFDAGMCTWEFTTPGASTWSTGTWDLSSNSCGCGTTGCSASPDPNYIGANTDTTGIPCTYGRGCNILTQGWEIIEKQSGNASSTPDSLDCTWGYAIQFTGCPSGTTVCSSTGFAPRVAFEYIPETYFTSGTGCV